MRIARTAEPPHTPAERGWRVGPDLARARDAFAFEHARDRAEADAGVVHLEDAPHDRRRLRDRVRAYAAARRPPPSTGSDGEVRCRRVGSRSSVDRRANARRSPARGPKRVCGVGCAAARPSTVRRRGSSPGRVPRCRGRLAADLGHPQFDAVVAQHREHELELRSRERALRFADDERVPVHAARSATSSSSRLASGRRGHGSDRLTSMSW